jgi:hypothetical protein
MLWIHPLLELMTILLGCYVLYLGWARLASTVLGQDKLFLWKRHVFLGKIAIYMWIFGAFVGAAAAWVNWRTFGVTGIHFSLGVAIVIIGVFGYWSGHFMDAYKKKRTVLPLIHGAGNFILCLLTFLLIGSGVSAFLKAIGKS